MSLFDRVYKTAFIQENKNIIPNSLDPQIFYFPESGEFPKLLPSVKRQILSGIDEINKVESTFTQTRVFKYVLTGPILNENASETCEVVIKVQLTTARLDDVLKEKILQRIKEINNKLIVGTRHPLIYIPTIRTIEIEKLNGAYNVFFDKWDKLPSFLAESKKSIEYFSNVKTKQKAKQTLTKGLKKLESA